MGRTTVEIHSVGNSGGSRSLSVADGIRRLNRRERKRNEGRFMIKERLNSKVSLGELSADDDAFISSSTLPADEDTDELLLPFIKAIGKNELAAFGIHKLAKLSNAIDARFSLLSLINKGVIESDFITRSKAIRKTGISDYESRIAYIRLSSEIHGGITLLTLASLYGRVGIVNKLLKSGSDPTIHNYRQTACHRFISIQVIKCIAHKMFPVSYAGWAVRCVNAMRLYASKRQKYDKSVSKSSTCKCCMSIFETESLLCWGAEDVFSDPNLCCQHSFCEKCWWVHWTKTVHETEYLSCPICSEPWPSGKNFTSAQKKDWYINGSNTCSDIASILERKAACLHRYLDLPPTATDLKRLPKRSKNDTYDRTWRDVIAHSIGKTQDVRMDKFLSAIARGSERYIRGCLELGVDIDATNEYGQSSLYIAVWKGKQSIVEMLIWYGANVCQSANGGLTIKDAAKTNGHIDILNLLNARTQFCNRVKTQGMNASLLLSKTNIISIEQSPKIKVLIDITTDHPGAGSIIIDKAVPDAMINALYYLAQELPIEPCKKVLKGNNNDYISLCSTRSYFCDSEGLMTSAIKENIRPQLIGGNATDDIIVFPHMRFLTYAQSGSKLARHIDLCRMDDKGNRSSHSFLLYLSDCQEGGETLLLQDLRSSECILGRVEPKRGRLLLFPHICPHEGNAVISAPKVLIRGEVMISPRNDV